MGILSTLEELKRDTFTKLQNLLYKLCVSLFEFDHRIEEGSINQKRKSSGTGDVDGRRGRDRCMRDLPGDAAPVGA